jgi:DegV family protein with EDD domain
VPPVLLVTDSSACLPPAIAGHASVRVVPISILLPGIELSDGPEAAEQVYEALATDTLVKSSPPSALDYLQVIESDGFDAAVVLTPAAEFTVMHRNALVAAKISVRHVEVVDTRTAAAAQGLVTLAALEALESGLPAAAVATAARDVARRTDLIATLPTVASIQRSGRVPAPALEPAAHRGPQPLFRFNDGAVVPLGEAGPETDPLEALRDEWTRGGGGDADGVFVFHAAHEAEARRLGDLLGGCAEIVPFSPAMAVHTGAGCVGVAWVRQPEV